MRRSLRVRSVLLFAASTCILGAGEALAQGSDPFRVPPQTGAPARDPAARTDASKSLAADGKQEPEQVVRSLQEWQRLLTPQQFMVTRMKDTEQPFSGKYSTGHFKGTFVCVCCGAKLFDARHKFDSGTGWPSFWRPVSNKAVVTAWDYSDPAEARVEVMCKRCGAHLGHVFQDGPPPTGLRYCMNSVVLSLETDGKKPAAAPKTSRPASARMSRNRPQPAASVSRKTGPAAEQPTPKS